jgi:hypothetical protein
MTMSLQDNHSVNCGQITDVNKPTQSGLQEMSVQTAS